MVKINETFHVRSLFSCESVGTYENVYEYDPLWRQTYVGCILLNILHDMFGFNISYEVVDYTHLPATARSSAIHPRANDSIDIYVRPMQLQADLLDHAYPIQAIFTWRLGFILRHRYTGILQAFYSQPFNIPVWICIYTMIVFGSLCFYMLSQWDTRQFGGECSFGYELLLAFSAYCQHILPLQATSNSRRIGYLTFIVCAYVVHSFYTSNLLSHLVSDKDKTMDLKALVESDYQFALLKDMNLDTDKQKYEKSMDNNLSIVWKKLLHVQIMNLTTALEAVVGSKTALVTEYFTLYPILKRYLNSEDICQLVEVDLYSKIKQYFFTSKNFSYKEEFKIGTLRVKEAGIMKNILKQDKYSPLKCEDSTGVYKAQFEHVLAPVIILFSAYVLALVVLVGERIHYQMNRVWPYVE
ncbi:ionotropic receptor 75a-like [Maniola hyperantus]|uniref:ionotropic receptor 75a-like n=1 Tax=Aphantopus hyperantus TaxID=2795564 RepID=UPI0015691336|nr:ionotropic receptor 75a-like [Maniola hyperantus]